MSHQNEFNVSSPRKIKNQWKVTYLSADLQMLIECWFLIDSSAGCYNPWAIVDEELILYWCWWIIDFALITSLVLLTVAIVDIKLILYWCWWNIASLLKTKLGFSLLSRFGFWVIIIDISNWIWSFSSLSVESFMNSS